MREGSHGGGDPRAACGIRGLCGPDVPGVSRGSRTPVAGSKILSPDHWTMETPRIPGTGSGNRSQMYEILGGKSSPIVGPSRPHEGGFGHLPTPRALPHGGPKAAARSGTASGTGEEGFCLDYWGRCTYIASRTGENRGYTACSEGRIAGAAPSRRDPGAVPAHAAGAPLKPGTLLGSMRLIQAGGIEDGR